MQLIICFHPPCAADGDANDVDVTDPATVNGGIASIPDSTSSSADEGQLLNVSVPAGAISPPRGELEGEPLEDMESAGRSALLALQMSIVEVFHADSHPDPQEGDLGAAILLPLRPPNLPSVDDLHGQRA